MNIEITERNSQILYLQERVQKTKAEATKIIQEKKSTKDYSIKLIALHNQLKLDSNLIEIYEKDIISIKRSINLRLIKSIKESLLQAAKTRVKRFKVLNPRVDLNGLYQESVDGRTPIDIYYFKKLVKVININGKATLVTRALEQPVTWRGTTGNNVTIMDRSQGKKVIYQAHRIVYAITTGIDPVESDIGYIDGNKDNYSFSNLIYKG